MCPPRLLASSVRRTYKPCPRCRPNPTPPHMQVRKVRDATAAIPEATQRSIWEKRGTWLHEELIALAAERLQNQGAEGGAFWGSVVRAPHAPVQNRAWPLSAPPSHPPATALRSPSCPQPIRLHARARAGRHERNESAAAQRTTCGWALLARTCVCV